MSNILLVNSALPATAVSHNALISVYLNNRPIALYQSVLESICDPIKGLFVWMHFQKLKIAKKLEID